MHSSALPCQTFSNVFNHEPANVFNQDPTNVFNNDPSRIGHAFKNGPGPGEPNRHCQRLFRLFVLFVLTQQPLFLSSNKSPPSHSDKMQKNPIWEYFWQRCCWQDLLELSSNLRIDISRCAFEFCNQTNTASTPCYTQHTAHMRSQYQNLQLRKVTTWDLQRIRKETIQVYKRLCHSNSFWLLIQKDRAQMGNI